MGFGKKLSHKTFRNGIPKRNPESNSREIVAKAVKIVQKTVVICTHPVKTNLFVRTCGMTGILNDYEIDDLGEWQKDRPCTRQE